MKRKVFLFLLILVSLTLCDPFDEMQVSRPFRFLDSFWNRFDDHFNSMFNRFSRAHKIFPNMDIIETKSDYIIFVDAPGMKKEELNIDIVSNEGRDYITLKGKRNFDYKENTIHLMERQFGAFTKRWGFNKRIKKDGVMAKMDNGVLIITIPKSETKNDEERIKVEIL